MVFINDKKFACESCIKGHRSSSCRHNDRPLFEIKKKGRPVSQCQKCRDLRQTRRVHSKCTCPSATDEELVTSVGPTTNKKSNRFVPITPSLPNGLKDALRSMNDKQFEPADPRQRVDTLLNPCLCKDVWNCRCRHTATSEAATVSLDPDCSGLAALARAATLQTYEAITSHSASENSTAVPSGSKQPRERSNSPSQHSSSTIKRRKHFSHFFPEQPTKLAPIRSENDLTVADVSLPPPLPIFPVFPTPKPSEPLAIAHSMSDCTCGYRCQCPGCVQHRGVQHASEDHADCADGCGTCIDYEGGVELPHAHSIVGASTSSSSSLPPSSIMDLFLARAAALPPPPVRSGSGTLGLDPTNVVIYPPSLFAAGVDLSLSKEEHERRGMAFGLVVNLPRLECCGGSCKCPEDTCACAEGCDGGCVDHTHGHGRVRGVSARVEESGASGSGPTAATPKDTTPVSSCCAGNAVAAQ